MTKETASELMIEDLRQALRDAEVLLQTETAADREQLEAMARRLGGRIRALGFLPGGAGSGRAAGAVTVSDRAIRQHPYQSVGTAFGFGLLLGMLMVR